MLIYNYRYEKSWTAYKKANELFKKEEFGNKRIDKAERWMQNAGSVVNISFLPTTIKGLQLGGLNN
ncbi:MAG: hypothetical protein HFG28_10300 [Eubacterium sp.]|nr:hypothetical protein [Eubacterium sp.]